MRTLTSATVHRPPLTVSDRHPLEAVRGNVAAYQAALRPFPKAPLEAVLTAFAKFEPPGRDKAE